MRLALILDSLIKYHIRGMGALNEGSLIVWLNSRLTKKGGTAVACSSMKEAEDNVIIWIARNEGFSDVDKLEFDKLGKVLGSLSCNSGTSRVTALFLLTKFMLLVQPINLRFSYGKTWSCIIRTGLNTAIFLA